MKASELISVAIDELHGSAKLSTTLLKVKTIAYLIKNQQLKDWVNLELNGYDGDIPEYRKIGVIPRATLIHVNFQYNGAQRTRERFPVEYLPKEEARIYTEKWVNNSIAEIEDWLEAENGVSIDIPAMLVKDLANKLISDEWIVYRAWQDFPPSQFINLLSTVRSKLLDLLLELNELGDDIVLVSLQQPQAVNSTVTKVLHPITVGSGGIVNVSHGDKSILSANTGNAAQVNISSGDNASQTNSTSPAAYIEELMAKIRETILDEAFAESRDEMQQQVQQIELQLQKPSPKKNLILRAFDSLRDLAAENAGVVAGHAIFELIKQGPELVALLSSAV